MQFSLLLSDCPARLSCSDWAVLCAPMFQGLASCLACKRCSLNVCQVNEWQPLCFFSHPKAGSRKPSSWAVSVTTQHHGWAASVPLPCSLPLRGRDPSQPTKL